MTSIAPLLSIGTVTNEEIAERLREQAGDGPAEKFIRLVIDQPDEHRAIKNAIAERRADVRDQISHRNREITRLSEGTVQREKRQQIEPRIKELGRERDRLRAQDEALGEKLRAARSRLTDAELLKIERIEEALIERAEAEGRQVQRRPDADPRAVLGVEVIGDR